MLRSLLILSLVLSFQFSQAQRRGGSWSYGIYVGASNMLSDLGGANANGSFGFKDMDLQATRPAIGASFYRHSLGLSVGANVVFTELVGSDAFTEIQSRAQRNLSVRTDLLEANIVAEMHPFSSIPIASRMHVSAGLGAIYFQPKANYNNEWVKLQPLGTEGQNYIVGATPYNRINVVVPFGAGYKFPLGRFSTLNLDFSFRKSFTDYLDDVSTVYANTAALLETGGELSAALADPSSLNFAEGSQRGNPNSNDNYFFVGLKFKSVLGAKNSSSCYFNDVQHQKRVKRNRRWMKTDL